MPVPKNESERKFEAIRDKILARTGVSLKKEQESVREYTVTPRKKEWERAYESTRNEILARGRARAERFKEEVRQTGRFPLEKSAEDFDPFYTRLEKFLAQPALQKEAVRNSRLAKYSGRARDRFELIKDLTHLNAQSPAPNLERSLRKERILLIEDLLCVFRLRKSHGAGPRM